MTIYEDIHIDLYEMNKQLKMIAEALDYIAKYLRDNNFTFERPG